ncbi:MAG: hypothetical protein ACHQ7M_23040, partial [Chloroflexota bacterium]
MAGCEGASGLGGGSAQDRLVQGGELLAGVAPEGTEGVHILVVCLAQLPTLLPRGSKRFRALLAALATCLQTVVQIFGFA